MAIPAAQLTLDQYLEQRQAAFIRTLETHTLPYLRKELAGVGSRAVKRRAELERDIQLWERELAAFAEGLPPYRRQRWEKEYRAAVRKAISSGKEVPDTVVAQDTQFGKAVTARQRYEKGRHTSFANQSSAVNTSPQAERGYKAKRQDGKAITPAQLAEIAAGMDEIEQVVGPLSDIFQVIYSLRS